MMLKKVFNPNLMVFYTLSQDTYSRVSAERSGKMPSSIPFPVKETSAIKGDKE
jgi:hypothetical protein